MIATRVSVRNFAGIQFCDHELPPGGVVFAGENAQGKTSRIKAFRALLERRGVDPDAIRNGADEAEIRIDFEHASVRAILRREGDSEYEVIRDGVPVKSPLKWLAKFFGAPLDPLDFFLQRPNESAPAARRRRRDAVIRAIPVKVTPAQLRKWVRRLPDDYDVSGHALDVVDRLYDEVFKLRSAANAERDAARGDKERAERELEAARAAVPPGAVPAAQVAPERDRAQMAVLRLEAQIDAARTHAARQAAARKRAADERAAAETLAEQERATRPAPERFAELRRLYAVRQDEERAQAAVVEDLARQLEAAKKALEQKRFEQRAVLTEIDWLDGLEREADALKARADAARNAAASIEAGLAESAGAPDPGALDAARAELARLEAALQAGLAFDRAEQLRAKTESSTRQYTQKERLCTEMDRAVIGLREEAPAELMPPGAIPGLSLRGDDILVNGVALEQLSGSERLKFAVRLAKLAARQNDAQAEILLCDDLEKLDPKQYELFLELATSDGFQLIGTRVKAGELACEWIRAA